MASFLAFKLLALLFAASVFQSDAQSCFKKQDVALVYELPTSEPDKFKHLLHSIQTLVRNMNADNHDCVRLGVIVAWKQVDTLIDLDCPYGDSPCYKKALRQIEAWKNASETYPHDRKDLVKAIDRGTAMLSSDNPAARPNVQKSMILVLSHSPEEDVMPAEDAVKDLHDQRIELYVLAIGDGRRNKLEHIALKKNIFMASDAANAVSVLRYLSQFVVGKLVVQEPVLLSQEQLGAPAPSSDIQSSEIGSLSLPKIEQVDPLQLILTADAKDACKAVIDLGLVIDSSGSLRLYYQKEKTFVKRMGAKLAVHEGDSKVGVVVFSSGAYVKVAIPFSREYSSLKDFSEEVDKLPLYGYQTRIDKALKVANDELFSTENGARPNVRKVLLLVTDGNQNPPPPKFDGLEKVFPPHEVAKALHDKNISIYAVGIGRKVERSQLESITRRPQNVYMLNNFDDLVADEFIKNITKKACEPAELGTSPAPTITFTVPSTSKPSTTTEKPTTTKEPSTTTKEPSTTTKEPPTTTKEPPTTTTKRTSVASTKKPTKPTSAPQTTAKKQDCDSSKQCKGCKCCSKCGKCCEQKQEVFVNVFNGANSNNVVLQDSEVTQSGAQSSIGQTGLHPKLLAGANLKNATSAEISRILKAWLPYQNKLNEAVQEVLRRGMQNHKKRGN